MTERKRVHAVGPRDAKIMIIQARDEHDDKAAKILEIMLNKWIEEHPEQYHKLVQHYLKSIKKIVRYGA